MEEDEKEVINIRIESTQNHMILYESELTGGQ